MPDNPKKAMSQPIFNPLEGVETDEIFRTLGTAETMAAYFGFNETEKAIALAIAVHESSLRKYLDHGLVKISKPSLTYHRPIRPR